MHKTAARLLLLQQLCRGRGLPLLVNEPGSLLLAQRANFLKDRDKPALAARAEPGFVGLDGEVQNADGGVLLHGEHPGVGVQHLDGQDAAQGLDGGFGELSEVLVLRRLV